MANVHTASWAFYNEIDPFAAAWLRELISAGLIAPGEVDERDIRDVVPADLAGFVQCHFFAGIGVWSYALRQAGWSDDRPIWTGSCPCQPFSQAGKNAGFDDERHLWPAFYWLIRQCRPELVAGEQVASGDANLWLDLVQADMEAMDHAFGCVPFPSAGVGAPHIRDRAFWVAHANGYQPGPLAGDAGEVRRLPEAKRQSGHGATLPGRGGAPSRMVDTTDIRHEWSGEARDGRPRSSHASPTRWLGDTNDAGLPIGSRSDVGRGAVREQGQAIVSPGPVNGLWRNSQWIWCSDERWRPIEPRITALAHGATARVGRLRGYGNAINAEAATAFIGAVMDHLSERQAA